MSKTLPLYGLKLFFLPLFLPTEGETLRCTAPFLHFSASTLSKGAKDVLISYAEVGKQEKWGRKGAKLLLK